MRAIAMSQLSDARLRAAAAYDRVITRGNRADVPGVPRDPPENNPPTVEPGVKKPAKKKTKTKSKKGSKSHMASMAANMKNADFRRGYEKGMAEIEAEDGDAPKDREELTRRATASPSNPQDGVLRAGKGMHGRLDMLTEEDRIATLAGYNGIAGMSAARELLPPIETLANEYSFTSRLAPGGSAPTQKQADRALADAKIKAGAR